MGAIVNSITGNQAANAGGFNAVAQTATLPFTDQQLIDAQKASQAQVTQQQTLAQQLAGQGGLGTQTSALAQQQALANQLQGTAGSQIGQQNQQSILAQQQALASQLQGQANGQGPNPAQAQFQQNLNAGTQAAAGTIASQKGISPALAAQLIAQQQGAANQNAAGGAATLQAQQQIAAQQALQAQQAQMQGVAGSQVGQQQAAIGQLQNQQQALQNVAGQQIGQQMAGQQAATAATQGQQAQMLGTQTQYQGINSGMQNAAQSANAGIAQTNAAGQSNLLGGMLGAAGKKAGFAEGGIVGGTKWEPHFNHLASIYHPHLLKMADGGDIEPQEDYYSEQKTSPVRTEEQLRGQKADEVILKSSSERNDPEDIKAQRKQRLKEQMLSPEPMKDGGYMSYQTGAKVPGTPKVEHNSYSNDTVKALLSPGEVVIPLDVMNSKDPVAGAAKFVQALMDKKEKGKGEEKEFHSALKDAISKRGKK